MLIHREQPEVPITPALDEGESKHGKLRKRLATGLLVGSVAVGAPHVVENWDQLWGRGIGYGAAYAGFAALYSASGLAKAGSALRRRFSGSLPESTLATEQQYSDEAQEAFATTTANLDSSEETHLEAIHSAENAALRREDRYLIANGVGAIGMGVTAAAATVALLPPVSWPVPLAAAAVDVGVSIWSRAELMHNRPPAPEGV